MIDYSCVNCHFSFTVMDTIFFISNNEFEEKSLGMHASILALKAEISGSVILYYCFICNHVKKYIIINSIFDLNKTKEILNKFIDKNSN